MSGCPARPQIDEEADPLEALTWELRLELLLAPRLRLDDDPAEVFAAGPYVSAKRPAAPAELPRERPGHVLALLPASPPPKGRRRAP